MDALQVGIGGCFVFLALTLLRVPIAYCMTIVGVGGLTIVYPPEAAFKFLTTGLFTYTSNFTLAALPLFILMGSLANNANLGRDAFDAAKAWFGRVPGGLGVATVYSSAIFGACSGSSLSAVAVFSKIAVPEMLRAGYSKRLSTGVVASAACLDALIPPSIVLVFYGVLTETSIGQLLVAGVVPGLLYAVIMATAITLYCRARPEAAPPAKALDVSWAARRETAKKLWAPAMLFLLVLGSIYAGWATPDEAAAVGVVGTLAVVWVRKELSWKAIKDSAVESAQVSAMIFLLLGAGSIFSTFLSATGVVSTVTSSVMALDLPFWILMLSIVLLYLFLGCFLDAISMMVLTMPLVAPLIADADASMVWFGVIVTMMMAIGAITPPLGLNCFVMKGALGNLVELRDIFMGALPFVGLMLLTVLILIAFPQLSLWLPELMRGR
jgi:tripartite ATP-independent transporter DctM subunit